MRAYIAIATGLLCGCSELQGYSLGEQRQLELELYPADTKPGETCFISCAIDRPLLVGTTERITATTHDRDTVMPFLSAQSSDPAVLGVEGRASTCCKGACEEGDHYEACLARGGEAKYAFSAKLTAVAEGSAHIQLFTPDGALFDQLRISVSRAHDLDVQVRGRFDGELGYQTVDELRLGGQHTELRVVPRDRDGDWMFASSGISMELTDSGVAAFYGSDTVVEAGRTEVWPLARGTDMLTVRATGATTRVPVVSE